MSELAPVDPGEFSLDANPMVAREDGLIVPAAEEKARVLRESTCFCGAEASEVFRGWGLCLLCAPRVKKRIRRMEAKPGKMSVSIKTRRSR